MLEKFLRCSMRSEELKSNYLLVQFLSCHDKKEYENLIKIVEKEPGTQLVKDLVTISGEVSIFFSLKVILFNRS